MLKAFVTAVIVLSLFLRVFSDLGWISWNVIDFLTVQ